MSKKPDPIEIAEAAVANARKAYDDAVSKLTPMQAMPDDSSREFTFRGNFYEFTEKVKRYEPEEREAAEEAMRQAVDALQKAQGRLNDLRRAQTAPAGRAPLR
jgi:hypothetical protein